MFIVFIDNNKYLLPRNITILTACQLINKFIPKFCFDSTLEISGNCRMCLVEVKGFLNPTVSCTFKIFNNINILTSSPLVKKSRENVLEFLLINHPLDCPICDQGGECDLQDLTLIYGSDKNRFIQYKKTTEDLKEDFFIKTIMTRCVLCTKCVRFMDLILNKNNNLGIIGRGKNMEIGFYIKGSFLSKFSTNIVDLCPVGALVLKPSSFISRNWYLKKYSSFDFFDSTCSNVIVHVLNNRVIKITPNINLNIEYLSNFSRFFFLKLYHNRLIKARLNYHDNGLNKNFYKKLSIYEFIKIFEILFKRNDPNIFKFVIGNNIDLKALTFLYRLTNQYALSNITCYKNVFNSLNYDLNSNFLTGKLCTTGIINNIVYILIDCNLYEENSSLFIKLNKKIKNKEVDVFSIGSKCKFFKNLGSSLSILINILEGKHEICKKLKFNRKFFLIFGKNYFLNKNNSIIISFIKNNYKSFIEILILYNLNLINFFEVFGNIKNSLLKNYKILYLYNTKNYIKYLNKITDSSKLFIIYHGTHITNDSIRSDLIIPSNEFYEKKNKYIDLYGNIKKSNQIINYFLFSFDNLLFDESELFRYLIPNWKKLNKFFYYLMETKIFISYYKFLNYSKLNRLHIKNI